MLIMQDTSLKRQCRILRRESRRRSRPSPQERIWCIFEGLSVPPEPSDAGDDATSLPPPDGVAGALAWLSRRPARVSSRSCNTRGVATACAGRVQRRRDGDALHPVPSKTLKGSFSRRTRHFRRADDGSFGEAFEEIDESALCRRLRRVPSSLTIWLAPPRAGRSRRHRGACLYVDGVRHGVPDYVFHGDCGERCSLLSLDQSLADFLVQSVTTSSRDKLWRASLPRFSVGQPSAGFLVKSMRLISHEHSRSDLRKSF